jgi:hypothetical protein
MTLEISEETKIRVLANARAQGMEWMTICGGSCWKLRSSMILSLP